MSPDEHGPVHVPVYIGIDGGGTYTRALVTDERGRELARAQGGAGIVDPNEPAAGAPALLELIDRLLSAAAVQAPVSALCCALTGAGRSPEQDRLRHELEGSGRAHTVVVVGDAEAAFRDAFGAGPGILLLAGTGSIALGRDAAGERLRAGGWGPLLGDEGSGYAIGLAALRAGVRAHDGRGPGTVLLQAGLAHARVRAPADLIAWAAAAAKAEIAALAPAALDLRPNDAEASRIAAEAVEELGSMVAAVARRLGPRAPTPLPVALAGGLIETDGPLRGDVATELRSLAMPLALLEEPVDAARGAAALARELGSAVRNPTA